MSHLCLTQQTHWSISDPFLYSNRFSVFPVETWQGVSYPNFLSWPSLTNRLDFSGDRKVLASNIGLRHSHVFLMGMQNSISFVEENVASSKKTKTKTTSYAFLLWCRNTTSRNLPQSYTSKYQKFMSTILLVATLSVIGKYWNDLKDHTEKMAE